MHDHLKQLHGICPLSCRGSSRSLHDSLLPAKVCTHAPSTGCPCSSSLVPELQRTAGRWEARIGIPGSKHIYLGLFEAEQDAACACTPSQYNTRQGMTPVPAGLASWMSDALPGPIPCIRLTPALRTRATHL